MINWSSKHIALIAGLFNTFFLGALTITALCDLEILDYASNLSHRHKEPVNVKIDNHHVKQNKAHSHHEHDLIQEQNADNHHPENEEDECCDDAAEILNSSLFYNLVNYDIPVAGYFLAGMIEFNPLVIPQYQANHIIYHEYDDPPPLNGFELRVEIQSFLN